MYHLKINREINKGQSLNFRIKNSSIIRNFCLSHLLFEQSPELPSL